MATPPQYPCHCCGKPIHPDEIPTRVSFKYNPETGEHEVYTDGIFDWGGAVIRRGKKVIDYATRQVNSAKNSYERYKQKLKLQKEAHKLKMQIQDMKHEQNMEKDRKEAEDEFRSLQEKIAKLEEPEGE